MLLASLAAAHLDLAPVPLWLSLLGVAVNALAGALHAYADPDRDWDIVGAATFALVLGLGGGLVRDAILGASPAVALRSPWPIAAVLSGLVAAAWVGRRIAAAPRVLLGLDALALGLFSALGAAHGVARGLPVTSSVLLGTITAVGGGVIVAVLKGEVPKVLQPSEPNALVAVGASLVFVALAATPLLATALASTTALAVRALVVRRGVTTRSVQTRAPRRRRAARWRERQATPEATAEA